MHVERRAPADRNRSSRVLFVNLRSKALIVASVAVILTIHIEPDVIRNFHVGIVESDLPAVAFMCRKALVKAYIEQYLNLNPNKASVTFTTTYHNPTFS